MNPYSYKFITTFWSDFGIAECFGHNAVIDTYNRAFEEWKNDYKYLTELVIVTNWKCWEHYDKGNSELSSIYAELYYKCRDYALDTLKGNELRYHLEVTD